MSTTAPPAESTPTAPRLWQVRIDKPVAEQVARLRSSAAVYLALALHADGAGRCYPTLSRIVGLTGQSRRHVTRAIRELETAGLLVVEYHGGAANQYLLGSAKGGSTEDGGMTQVAGESCRGCHTGDDTGGMGGLPPVAHRRKHHRSNSTEETPLKKHQRGKAAVAVEIPEELAGDDFKEAWGRWSTHRREIKKALTPSTAAAQLKKLAAMGVARAVGAIDHSIEKGWTGIFEPNGEANGNHTGKRNGFPLGPGQRHGEPASTPGVF